MPDDKKITVDLTDCKVLIANAETLIDVCDKTVWAVDSFSGPARRNDPALAQVARDLLEIKHRLQHAAMEAEAQYYRLKGRSDPRFED